MSPVGAGVLGQVLARTLAEAGAHVWIADLAEDRAAALAAELRSAGLVADATGVNVLERAALEAALEHTGPADVLINAAGGNVSEATTGPERPFFDLPLPALERVIARTSSAERSCRAGVWARWPARQGA